MKIGRERGERDGEREKERRGMLREMEWGGRASRGKSEGGRVGGERERVSGEWRESERERESPILV